MPTPAEELAQYRPLIYSVVAPIYRRLRGHVDMRELLAAANSGLWEHFVRTPSRNEKHLRMRIRGAVLDWLRTESCLTRVPRERGDALVNFDGIDWSIEPSLHTQPEALDGLVDASERASLAAALAQLGERDRRVLEALVFREMRQEDLAAEMGISEPRVSQLYQRAITRLRTIVEETERPSNPPRAIVWRTRAARRPPAKHAR